MSISCKLAKELKDAGFPQKESNGFPGILNPDGDKDLYYPTLEELISECGEHFKSLEKVLSKEASPWWLATGYMESSIRGYVDNDPDEAVARLWLALQAAKQPKSS